MTIAMRGEQMKGARRARIERLGISRFLLLGFCALVVVAGGAKAHAQNTQPGNGVGAPVGTVRGYPQQNGSFPMGPGDDVEAVDAERRLNALNEERQKAMTSDAAKLLKLATELNEQIAKSNHGELSPEQLRMVAEIEKLAHNVRDKMSQSLRGPQYPAMDNAVQPFPQTPRH